jgi:NAD dependent epimerase/dehydratase family enzyme
MHHAIPNVANKLVCSLSGPVNAVAPELIDNNRFTQALSSAYGRRPILPAVPAFPLQLALGKERAAMLLEGQKVVPKKALDAGFQFEYPTIDKAVAQLVSK